MGGYVALEIRSAQGRPVSRACLVLVRLPPTPPEASYARTPSRARWQRVLQRRPAPVSAPEPQGPASTTPRSCHPRLRKGAARRAACARSGGAPRRRSRRSSRRPDSPRGSCDLSLFPCSSDRAEDGSSWPPIAPDATGKRRLSILHEIRADAAIARRWKHHNHIRVPC